MSLRIDRPRQAAKQNTSRTWLREQRRGGWIRGGDPLDRRFRSHAKIPTGQNIYPGDGCQSDSSREKEMSLLLRVWTVSNESVFGIELDARAKY